MVTKPLDRLRQAKAVAMFRHPRPADVVGFIEAMMEAGWKAVEISCDTPGAFGAVSTARSRFGDAVYLGVGTVNSADAAKEALDAGAHFVVSPVHVPAVVEVVRDSDALCISGGLTPTEIFHAWEDGADAVKVFPIGAMADNYLTQLKGPFPHIPLMPTGGVDAKWGRSLLDLGAVVVGVGAAAIDFNAVEVQRWSWVRERGEAFLRDLGGGE